MENQVVFRANQQLTSDDLNNIEAFVAQTFQDLISDVVDSGFVYAGLLATASGTTGVSVGIGRVYNGGQIYDNPNAQTLSVQSQLPVAAQKIATIVAWGVEVQENIEPRAFIINADTGQFQPQNVALQSAWQVQLSLVFGAESASPVRGTIANTLIAIADVLLGPSGILSINMDPTSEVGSIEVLESDVNSLTSWQAQVSQQIATLSTDLSILASSIPANLIATLAGITAQLQLIMNLLLKPATAFFSSVTRFNNLSDAQTGATGYLAKIEDGLRFPDTSDGNFPISLLNPIDAGVQVIGNMTLPTFSNQQRYAVLPTQVGIKIAYGVSFFGLGTPWSAILADYPTAFQADWIKWAGFSQWGIWNIHYYVNVTASALQTLYISSAPVVALDWKQVFLSRQVTRYGDLYTSAIAAQPNTSLIYANNASNSVGDQSSAAGIAEIARRPALLYYQANRSSGEPYTFSWPSFWQLDNPSLLVSVRNNGCWFDFYNQGYWDAAYTVGSNSGSCVGMTFLNQTNGWLTQINLYPALIGAAGDVRIYVVNVDNAGAPNAQRVLSQTDIPVGNLFNSDPGIAVSLTPCFLSGGSYYGIIIQTSGNHSFYCIGAQELQGFETVPGFLWTYNGAAWVYSPTQTPLIFQIYMAKFTNSQYALQLQPVSLAGGINSLRIMCAAKVPPGTYLSWQAQISGAWIPLDGDNVTALAASPALIPMRVVFGGTSSVMPGIDLTEAEIEPFVSGTSLDYFSNTRTLTAATVSVKVDIYIQNWNAANMTYTAKLHSGGTTYTPSTTVDTIDPQTPTTIKREFSFVPTSTESYYYELIGTHTLGDGYPLVQECWDSAF